MTAGQHLAPDDAPRARLPAPWQGCACRWAGSERISQCKLHEAWEDTLREYAERLRAQPGAPRDATAEPTDTERLDWLETMTVNVRHPLRYGSRNLFWSSPEDMDGGPSGPSDIRKQIDAARAGQAQGGAR